MERFVEMMTVLAMLLATACQCLLICRLAGVKLGRRKTEKAVKDEIMKRITANGERSQAGTVDDGGSYAGR